MFSLTGRWARFATGLETGTVLDVVAGSAAFSIIFISSIMWALKNYTMCSLSWQDGWGQNLAQKDSSTYPKLTYVTKEWIHVSGVCLRIYLEMNCVKVVTLVLKLYQSGLY